VRSALKMEALKMINRSVVYLTEVGVQGIWVSALRSFEAIERRISQLVLRHQKLQPVPVRV
jgi:hypothetical protein